MHELLNTRLFVGKGYTSLGELFLQWGVAIYHCQTNTNGHGEQYQLQLLELRESFMLLLVELIKRKLVNEQFHEQIFTCLDAVSYSAHSYADLYNEVALSLAMNQDRIACEFTNVHERDAVTMIRLK